MKKNYWIMLNGFSLILLILTYRQLYNYFNFVFGDTGIVSGQVINKRIEETVDGQNVFYKFIYQFNGKIYSLTSNYNLGVFDQRYNCGDRVRIRVLKKHLI